MALVRYTDASGKSGSVAGSTFSRNTYGSYIRARVTPTNPRTSAQATVRTNFAAASAYWRSLSESNRAQWGIFADLYTWTNALGEAGKLKPNALFCSFASDILLAGLALADLQPAYPQSTEQPLFTFTNSDADLTITWGAGTWKSSANYVALIYGATAVPTRTSDLVSRWRYLGKQAGAVSPPTTTAVSLPIVPTAGDVIRVGVVVVKVATGYDRSPWKIVSQDAA